MKSSQSRYKMKYKSKWHKARELEIEYNFLHRKTWGHFPHPVQQRYSDFCWQKRIFETAPSIKCGYITDWKQYGKTLEEAIDLLKNLILDDKQDYKSIKDEEGSTPFERSGGYMRDMVGAG